MSASIGGRSVIVTGASNGIARAFASIGAKVLVVVQHLDDAEKAAAEISKPGWLCYIAAFLGWPAWPPAGPDLGA